MKNSLKIIGISLAIVMLLPACKAFKKCEAYTYLDEDNAIEKNELYKINNNLIMDDEVEMTNPVL